MRDQFRSAKPEELGAGRARLELGLSVDKVSPNGKKKKKKKAGLNPRDAFARVLTKAQGGSVLDTYTRHGLHADCGLLR